MPTDLAVMLQMCLYLLQSSYEWITMKASLKTFWTKHVSKQNKDLDNTDTIFNKTLTDDKVIIIIGWVGQIWKASDFHNQFGIELYPAKNLWEKLRHRYTDNIHWKERAKIIARSEERMRKDHRSAFTSARGSSFWMLLVKQVRFFSSIFF